MKHINGTNGFLFVGDPHVSTRKPGRRKDDDYVATILGKLEESVSIANDRNLNIILLGDLFDRPFEESDALKTRVIRTLKKATNRIVYILGNHERIRAKLSDDDSLTLFKDADIMDIIETTGAYGIFDFNGVRVGLGGTPHGEKIPTDIRHMFEGEHACKTVVWLTHHDLEFEGAYPKSIPTHEIQGCKLVVNGHMHMTKKVTKEGATTWLNPGNITRQAIDAINHVPRVWEFNSKGKIEPIPLTFKKDVFDLTGRLVNSIEEENDAPADDNMESVFVQLIQSEDATEFAQTDDGTVIREQIETLFEKQQTETNVRSLIVGLLNKVVDEAA